MSNLAEPCGRCRGLRIFAERRLYRQQAARRHAQPGNHRRPCRRSVALCAQVERGASRRLRVPARRQLDGRGRRNRKPRRQARNQPRRGRRKRECRPHPWLYGGRSSRRRQCRPLERRRPMSKTCSTRTGSRRHPASTERPSRTARPALRSSVRARSACRSLPASANSRDERRVLKPEQGADPAADPLSLRSAPALSPVPRRHGRARVSPRPPSAFATGRRTNASANSRCRRDGHHGAAPAVAEGSAGRGARSLVIGVANSGGFIADCWVPALVDALDAGLRHRQRDACAARRRAGT